MNNVKSIKFEIYLHASLACYLLICVLTNFSRILLSRELIERNTLEMLVIFPVLAMIVFPITALFALIIHKSKKYLNLLLIHSVLSILEFYLIVRMVFS